MGLATFNNPGLYPGILGKGPWPNWEKKMLTKF